MWWIRRSMMATGRWLPTRRAKPKRWSGATLLPETWPMQRSEVWWVEFDPAVGSEIRKTRPAVIVSNNAANRNLARVVVVPLTSTGQRHNHHPRQIPVGRVVANDDCRTGLAYLAADCRVKLNPPHFTALHRPCLRQERCTTPSLRLRAPCR